MDNEAVAATFADTDAQWAVEAEFNSDTFAPVEADAFEPAEVDDALVVTALADEDAVALEQGIADVFDTLRAEVEEHDEDADEVEPTYALLAELNRLWVQPQSLAALS